MTKIYLIVLASILIIACGDDHNDSTTDSINLTMHFERIAGAGLNPFQVTITITNNGIDVTDATPDPLVNKGTISDVTNNFDGSYLATITPDTTGEYEVSVTYGTQTLTRTALVLQNVHADWGQPQAVPGYVNTAGYEDGVTITPDGQYLFVQTGPYRWSSLIVYSEPRENGGCGGNRLIPDRCNHPWVNEITGTISAPERPDFYTSRFSGTTQLHNAASWGIGVDGTPNYALTTLFYGFKKQGDGSFKEPFYMAFNDLNDGIIGPFGLSFMDNGNGNYTTIFALKDAFTTDESFDIYAFNATFGVNNNLGDYEFSSIGNPPTRGSFFPSTLVDLGDNSGTQGNPFLYYTDNTIQSLWTDDEYDSDEDTHKLTVYVLNSGNFPSTGNWTKVLLPANVNQVGKEAIQPTFIKSGLYFTQDTSVAFAAYSGTHTAADIEDNSSWSLPVVILQKDTTISSLSSADIDKIIAIGEPTVAMIDDKETLYFVYGYIRSIDPITGYADLDFQAGFISKN